MTRLIWGAAGERFFETGVDRGVLYPPSGAGVPWNGLTSVRESPSGGDVTPYYIDGYKYINVASAEEFEAKLEAFSSPREFDVCDGTLDLSNGLFAYQQPRLPFGLSYRSKIGNDIDGPDHGYKIHIVYNAMAEPADRDYSTTSDSPEAPKLSWDISTTPPIIPGFRPTSHFVVDSRSTNPGLLDMVEDMLYGSDTSTPMLPTAADLIALFQTGSGTP